MRNLSLHSLAAVLLSVLLISCDSSDSKKSDSTSSTPLSPTEQQKFLEETALTVLDCIPSADSFNSIYNDLVPLGEIGDFEASSSLGKWAESLMDSWSSKLKDPTVIKNESKVINSFGDVKNLVELLDTRLLVSLANVNGHFYVANKTWVREDANDIQISFKDSKLKDCLINAAVSGNSKAVHLMNDSYSETYKNKYDEKDDVYYYYDTVYDESVVIDIPEHFELSYSYDGKNVLSISMNVNLGSIQSEEFNIDSSSMDFSVTLSLNNGLSISIDKLSYAGNGKEAREGVIIAMNGKPIASSSVQVTPKGLPSGTLSNIDDIDYNPDILELLNYTGKVDILGKVQFISQTNDIIALNSYFDFMEKDRYDEQKYKEDLETLNTMFSCGLYYNNSDTKQAGLIFEPIEKQSRRWNSSTQTPYMEKYWDLEPVIQFFDGSKTAMPEEFFSEEVFSALIDRAVRLATEFSNAFDF